MKQGIGQRDQPRTRFDNYSGEAVPPYAVLRIDDTAATEKHALKAYKPNGTSGDCTFALNLNRQVAHNASTPKHAGTCTNAYGAWALYDDANTPAPGEEWGPDSDWLLHKGKGGYVIVGGAEDFTVGATTYRRVRVPVAGGASGDPIVYGQLINSVPANSTLESCIRKETFDTWFSLVYDPPESEDLEDVVLLHAGNPSLNSEYRGSTDEPIRVWGVMRTTEVSVESVPVMVSTFIIHGEFKDQVAASAGFVKSPDNDKGQAMMHTDGSAATVVDGGPCGGA